MISPATFIIANKPPDLITLYWLSVQIKFFAQSTTILQIPDHTKTLSTPGYRQTHHIRRVNNKQLAR